MIGRTITPTVIGPIVKAADWADFDIMFDAPEWEGQVVGADIFVNTTIATAAANFMTITLEKITNTGAGAATSMAARNTSSASGSAITAARRNAMTLQGTTNATLQYNGHLSEGSSDTDQDALNLDFNAATATVAALDLMVVNVRHGIGMAGGR